MPESRKLNLKWHHLVLAAITSIVIVLLALAPLSLGHYYLSVIRTTLMWAALTMSWYFFSGLTGYISLGSTAFFGTGLYFTALYLNFSVIEGRWPELPFPVIVLMAGLLNFGFAFVPGLISLRLRGIYFAIATFALGMACQGIFDYLVTNVMGTYYTHIPSFNPQMKYYSMLTTTIAVFLIIFLLCKSKLGLALKMIGENEEAAVHLGVNANLVKTLGFAISAMCMGFVGSSYAIIFPVTGPKLAFDLKYSFLPAIMAMFGGIGTSYGPLVGAVALSLLNEYLGVTLVHYFLIILGVIVIIIAELMPEGIVGFAKKMVVKYSRGKQQGLPEEKSKGLKTPL
ncbi:MAG: branched-chain amino acid ABC transporter permease [Candidatus Bathyarchaeia archaeon]